MSKIDISPEVEQISNATFGRDVRQSICDALTALATGANEIYDDGAGYVEDAQEAATAAEAAAENAADRVAGITSVNAGRAEAAALRAETAAESLVLITTEEIPEVLTG